MTTSIISDSSTILREAGFSTKLVQINERSALAIESEVILGFVFHYETISIVKECWEKDINRAIADFQFSLRRSGQKAWNAYAIFLVSETPTYEELAALIAIEENLVGTRKIARADIKDETDLRSALLSLLPIQNAPQLESIDIENEIRQRASEIEQQGIDAFFSQADSSVILQILEDT